MESEMADPGKRDLKLLLLAGFLLMIGVVALGFCSAPNGGPPPTSGAPAIEGGAR
jgi:hypothetical protein